MKVIQRIIAPLCIFADVDNSGSVKTFACGSVMIFFLEFRSATLKYFFRDSKRISFWNVLRKQLGSFFDCLYILLNHLSLSKLSLSVLCLDPVLLHSWRRKVEDEVEVSTFEIATAL